MPHESRHSPKPSWPRLTKSRASAPRQNEDRATYVYVVTREDDCCKIGVSRNVRRRRSELQESNPDKLSVFFSAKPSTMTALEVETAAMRALAPWRKRGEWFACTPALAVLVVREVQQNAERLGCFLHLLRLCHETEAAWEKTSRQVSQYPRRHYPVQRALGDAAEADALNRMNEANSALDAEFPEWSREVGQVSDIRL